MRQVTGISTSQAIVIMAIFHIIQTLAIAVNTYRINNTVNVKSADRWTRSDMRRWVEANNLPEIDK